MPRTKKKVVKERRKKVDRRKSNPGDAFWTRVANGMKKLLSPAFPKK